MQPKPEGNHPVEKKEAHAIFTIKDWENRCAKCFLHLHLCYCRKLVISDQNAEMKVSLKIVLFNNDKLISDLYQKNFNLDPVDLKVVDNDSNSSVEVDSDGNPKDTCPEEVQKQPQVRRVFEEMKEPEEDGFDDEEEFVNEEERRQYYSAMDDLRRTDEGSV